MNEVTSETLSDRETSMIEFEAFPKIPRFNRDITITEKIDGTNAAVIVVADPCTDYELSSFPEDHVIDPATGLGYRVGAQSRKRIIVPGDDNFGFAKWVREHAVALVTTLGEGRHFGEWWGLGIQRRYDLDHKRFSLFNTHRWSHLTSDTEAALIGLDCVPVLYQGPMEQSEIDIAIEELRRTGSRAAPGFMRPEGVVVYHSASRSVFKALLEGDEVPKALAEAA